VLSQIYQILNNQAAEGNKQLEAPLAVEAISEFLGAGNQQSDKHYDENEIKITVLKQKFLIAKGFFRPKEYFPSIEISGLDDPTFDKKLTDLVNNTTENKSNS